MYNHEYMDPTKGPQHLQRKVQFDIRFYFCHRGCENIEKMLKTDFEVQYNREQEAWCVIKIHDELTKNHHQLENTSSGIMPENKTDPLCPVVSFRKYISHLHPENKYMWQYTVDEINPKTPDTWFTRKESSCIIYVRSKQKLQIIKNIH